jgi:hypothetical protein
MSVRHRAALSCNDNNKNGGPEGMDLVDKIVSAPPYTPTAPGVIDLANY